MGSEQKRHDSAPPGPRALWPVDLKLTHLDWNPEATLIHFQGQYLTICELDYNILQGEIQNVPKAQATVDIGEFCLVEDVTSARWYRGRVQNQKKDLYDVFLIDHGNVLSVDEAHISSCTNDLFILPPKIVCGFLSSVLVLPDCSHSVVEQYFSNLIGRNVTGYIQALLPHKVLLLEAPDINSDLVRHGFGKHVDTDTFLLLVEMLTEAPLKQNIEPAPDLLIEKQRGQEFNLKPTSLKGYEEILSFCRPKFKCGSHVTVHVTAAVRPELFYCQIADKESELKEFSNKLAAVCEFKAKINKQRTPDNLGLLCSVKGKDNKWYRGFVQHLPINSLVRVLFVDYGYFESVEVENIHKLPPDFSLTPIMAFPCALSGMNSEDEDFKSQQLGFLKTGLLGGLLEIKINKQEQHLYYITILSIKESVLPTPIQSGTCTKRGNNESENERSSPQKGHLFCETIMSKELDKSLEDEKVQVGSVFVGYLEHVQNPNHFWVRTEKRNEEFEEMMKKLSEHFSNVKLEEDILESPEPGMLCCAVYEEDMHYYRGVVVDLLEHGAEVLFIDFGNIGKVPHNLIKKIPEEFADKSAFAMCCSLVSVVPNDEFWPISASDSFRRLLSNKELQVHVMQMRKTKFDVDLYLVEGGTVTSQSISDLLIATNQAQYGKNISGQFMKKKKIYSAKMKVVKQNNQPLQNTKKCENWAEETNVPKVQTEKSKEPVCLKALNIKPGSEFAVFCPLIHTPSDFWCQRLDNVPALDALLMKLQDHYSTRSVPLEPEALSCVVKSPNASQWCRGIITERRNGRAKVSLADFGSSIQVSEESLQGLLPEFCVLEGQAFRCSLYNVIEPLALGWTSEASEFLKTFVEDSGSSLKCKVISQLNVRNRGLCNVVHLCNTESDQSVSNLLLERSLARVVTTTLSPTVFPESFVFSSYDLTVGSEEPVHVTHVNSHFEILCQLDKNSAILEEIDAKISEIKKVEQTNPQAVEKLCLAKYLDGKWYRGIAYPAQSPSHLCVTFVDYGNTIIAEKKHVIFIPRDSTDLLYTPMQALKFTLAWVPQDLVFADVKEWLDAAILNKLVRAVIEAKGEDGSFKVELFDGEVSINEKLKDLIHSLTPKPKIAVTFKTSGKKIKERQTNNGRYKYKATSSPTSNPQYKTNKNKANTNSQMNRAGAVKSPQKKKKRNQVTNAEDANGEISPAKSQTAPTIEGKTDTDETCQREKPTMFQVSSLPAVKLTEGLKLRCFVTHVESLSSFYLQLSDDEANILKIVEDLNSRVFRDTLKSTTNTILKVNDLVLAEYEEDGSLYRAVVKEAVGFCTFKVEFVDFGNSALMGKEKIYLITKDYITQPRYSIHCSLRDGSTFEDSAAFTDAVIDKPLMVEFICYKKSQWEVKVEILGATTTSTPLEAVVPKETAAPKENSTPPEVKRPTHTKQKTTKHTKRHRIRVRKNTTQVDKLKDFVTVFMPPNIQSGDTHTGLVLSVQTYGDFYVRLCKSLDALAALETLIAINIKNCDLILEKHVKEGLRCLVQEQHSGPWCRAAVKEITDNACLVLLSDHGKMVSVAKSSLRQMLSNLEMIPPFAVHCRLNTLIGSQQYSQMCYETMKAIKDKEVKLVFVDILKKEQLWFVEMVMDGQYIMQHVLSAERRTQLDSTKAYDTSPGADVPQKLAFAPVELNKEYFGFAAAVTTPLEFCVVLEDLPLMSQVSVLLEDIRDELEPLPRAHLIPGTGCLVKSESKKKWCRAEILHADSILTINLVDYGHDECLSYEDHSKLRKLPKCIAELPKVTYPCTLKAVRPAGAHRQWTDEAAIFFQQCLDQRNLQIFFREEVSKCQWKVDVLANGMHLAKQLVDAGHATYTDVMLGLRFQELSCGRSLRYGSDDECDEDAEVSSQRFEEIEQIFKEESDSNLCMMM